VLTEAGAELHAAARVTHRAALRAAFLDRLTRAQPEQLAGAWTRVAARRARSATPART